MFLPILLALAVILSCAVPAAADGTWTCPACGHENPDRANFCGSCRQPRPTAEVTGTAELNAWVCASCGEICPDADSFCMICGGDRHENDPRALLIPELEVKSMTPDPALVEVTDLMFTEEGASQSFEYAPPVTGRYFLFLKSAESGFRIRISVSDAQGENLGTEYAQRGDGLTVNLEAGARYNVEVAQSKQIGSFTFGIGVPREWTDLQDCGVVSDSMSFTYQDNRFTITPRTSGIHYFWIAQAMNGFRTHLVLEDEQGYKLSDAFAHRDEGVTGDLQAGTTYRLHVDQSNDLGEYQLNIGRPKPVTDLSGCSLIGDILTYEYEQNVYTYTAPEDGTYEFKLARANNAFRVRLTVLDQGGYKLGDEYLQQDGSVSVQLAAGKTCTVKVEQNKNFGTYNLMISH